ncbi:MAG: sigma-70 family RNA polymerase sigma factor [Planctomycetes bacterium]|nr:sigma-70 family RNA polymerase sigma factor [Planctomycetota bacterium]
MTPEDPAKQVILKARDGDRDAFGEIVTHYQRLVYNLAFRMCRDRAEAWDMAQEAFLRTFRNLGKYDPQRAFRPWLMRVATNVCLNWIRDKRPSMPTVSDVADPEGEPLQAVDDADPAMEAAGRDAAKLVRDAVAELAPNYRVVVTLRYLEELSYGEIADRLDLPIGTVKNRLFRSREMLKETLRHLENGL